MNKHTTGPWKATHALGDQGIARHIWSATDGVTSHRELVAMIPDVDGDREHINADARLIAAAPELLEALIECERCVNELFQETGLHEYMNVSDLARAAIAKATGGAP
jgi:hypothetical protein